MRKNNPISDEDIAALYVDIKDIEPNPLNPRGPVKPEDVAELVESVKVHGVLEPIIVDIDTDRIIAGERRYVAAKLAGLEVIPVIFRFVESDRELRELALIENVQREDLKPITEAKAYADLMESGLTVEEINTRTGISEGKIRRMLRLLKLPENVQRAIENQTLSIDAGLTLLQIEDTERQHEVATKAIEENLTTADIRQEAGLKPWSKAKRGKASNADRSDKSQREVIINHAIDSLLQSAALLESVKGFEDIATEVRAIQERVLTTLTTGQREETIRAKNALPLRVKNLPKAACGICTLYDGGKTIGSQPHCPKHGTLLKNAPPGFGESPRNA